jgi:hypothetical protein
MMTTTVRSLAELQADFRAVVVLAYLYSLAVMRPTGPQAEVRPATA